MYLLQLFLESVLLEMRAGQLRDAVSAAESALTTHAGTGRLWAVLIQVGFLWIIRIDGVLTGVCSVCDWYSCGSATVRRRNCACSAKPSRR
jgi:hypothetical protein